MFKPFSSVTKCFKMILILLGSSLLNSSITFFDKFQIYESYFELPNAPFFVFMLLNKYMSGLAGLSRGTRVPICPDTICVPWDRDRDRSLRDERDRDRFSRDCPAWLSRGTSGTGTKNRGTVPSRPLPIPA